MASNRMNSQQHVRVMLEYFYPWTNSAGFYMARHAGAYAKHGIDVELRTHDPGRGDGLEYLLREEVEFAIVPSNRLFVQRDKGMPVVGVAAINHRGMEAIQTIRGKGINRPADLAGKRLALNPTPRGMAMVRHLVAADGGDADAIIVVDSGVREFTPEQIVEGYADATFGSYWAWEVLMDSQIPHSKRIIWPVDTIGAPAYHSYILATRDDVLQRQPDMVRQLLAATAEGFMTVGADPQSALPIYEGVIPYFPEAFLARSLRAVVPTWFHNDSWGNQRSELMEPYAAWMADNRIIKDAHIWRQAHTNRFLPTR